jgi:hypothetical protein
VKEQICKNRDYTALWDSLQEFFSEAKKTTEMSRKRSAAVTEVEEDVLALRAQKRAVAASPEREAPLTPTYMPKEGQ